ncbi:MAG: hypothetical protein HQM13_24180 [SAR324 cluster bacterium]|nr:hypothetical protein [SAR324 cluster bacterium]
MTLSHKFLKFSVIEKFLIGWSMVLLFLVFFQWYELALGVFAFFPFLYLIFRSILDGTFEIRFLSIGYLGGQSLCWLIGFLGCLYILPLLGYPLVYLFNNVNGLPVKYTLVTMILVNLTMWGGLFGSQLALIFQKKQSDTIRVSTMPIILVRNGIVLTAIIFLVYLVSSYIGGSLSARTLIGSRLPVGSLLYWVTGLGGVSFLFFFFAGAYLCIPFFSLRNVMLLLILFLCMSLSGLTGGRGTSIQMLLFFLGGSFYSNISPKKVTHLTLVLVPFVLAFLVVIGAARSENFTTDPFEQRLEKVWHTMTVTVPEQWKNRTYYFLRRIANDLAGQLVIDSVVERQEYIGFRNFERLATIFVPKFVIGDKASADDGPERLRDDYGLLVTDFHSIPITFMADAFERGGYFATFSCSFLLSFWLTLLGRFIWSLNWPLFRAVLMTSFAYHCLNIQTYSVIGTIREVTYTFVKDAILMGGIVFFISFISLHGTKTGKP